ncbi:MAG: hypothetical protein ABH864_00205 [archaeon]
MSLFNNDPFENIVNEFFGNSLVRQRRNHLEDDFEEDSEEYENIRKSYGNTGKIPVKKVLSPKKIYFLFDFSGEEKIKVKTKRLSQGNNRTIDVLEIAKADKRIGEFILPEKIKTKNMVSSTSNGILEVSFER